MIAIASESEPNDDEKICHSVRVITDARTAPDLLLSFVTNDREEALYMASIINNSPNSHHLHRLAALLSTAALKMAIEEGERA